MGNFSKNVKKIGLTERLEQRIFQLEKFEARATMVLAIYDAMVGNIDPELLKHTSEEMGKSEARSQEDFYRTAKAVATTWLQEKEMAEQSAALQSSPDTSDDAALD